MALGRTLRVAAVVMAIGALASTAEAASQTVTVQNFAFVPASLTISVGDSVTWTNHDAIGHTATSNAGSPATFDKPLAANGSATVAFSVAGTYAYHCAIHPFMTGTIVVLGPTPAPSTPRPTPPPTAPPTVPPTAPPTAPPATEPPTASPAPSPSPSLSPSPTATPAPAATATGTPITVPTGVALASPTPASGTGADVGSGPGAVLAAGALALALVLGGAALYLYRRR